MYKIQNSLIFDFDDVTDRYETKNNIDKLRQDLLKYTDGFILETCVGTSRNIKKILAIDWNPNYLEVALSKPNHNSIDIDYMHEDVEKMGFKNDVFDCIVDTFGLDYTLYPLKCLEQMKRVCKPGGKILLLECGLSHYEFLNTNINLKEDNFVSTYGFYNNRDWDQIIEQSGLKIIQQNRYLNGTIYSYVLENAK